LAEDRLKIAVFIDFDNIEIGVKSTLGTYFDIGAVLEAIKERGEVVTKVAYGDWTRAGDYGRALSQHAVHMVQRNLTPGGDKNGADINLALDALEMAFTHNHINSFVIVSGDSDFISLVEKLKQYDRKVFVVGGRAFTSMVMQKNCTEFVAYENIVGRGRSADRARSGPESSLAHAMPLVRRALKLLADREVLPQLGLLKSTLLQLDSAFSEREYGASSFRDFVQKLAKAGLVTLKGSERSFQVELREGNEPLTHTAPPSTAPHAAPQASPAPAPVAYGGPQPPVNGSRANDVRDVEEPAEAQPVAARPDPAEAVRIIQQAVAAATAVRWPLYVRQMKQLIRAVDPQFDERRYGFGSLIEALKHAQRDGLLRVERDRQGIVRVWPGTQASRSAAPAPPITEPAYDDVTAAEARQDGAGFPPLVDGEPIEDAEIADTRVRTPAQDERRSTADNQLVEADEYPAATDLTDTSAADAQELPFDPDDTSQELAASGEQLGRPAARSGEGRDTGDRGGSQARPSRRRASLPGQRPRKAAAAPAPRKTTAAAPRRKRKTTKNGPES
jgi:uncharacterized LabA/DUF88 family protein